MSRFIPHHAFTCAHPSPRSSFVAEPLELRRLLAASAFHFTSPFHQVTEHDGAVVITVERTGDTSTAATVDYATVNGTARFEHGDYTSAQGTLTFAAGETSKDVSITILDDAEAEPTETFTVVLSNATGAAAVDQPDTETVAIADDDSLPAISAGDVAAAISSAGNQAIFTVSLSAPAAIPVTVAFATADNTALAGRDYIPISGTLTFAPGETTQTIAVQSLASPLTVPPRSFFVNFGGAQNASIADAQAVGVIGTTNSIIVIAQRTEAGPQVRIFDANTGQATYNFNVYPASTKGTVRVAAGDVDGDGVPDIITARTEGAPEIKVFSGVTGQPIAGPLASFNAFDYTGHGAYVAAADLNGDGRADIIAASDKRHRSDIRVFDGATGLQMDGPVGAFSAFDGAFLGWTAVASGDVNGDGKADIITGAHLGVAPRVRIFSGVDGSLLRELDAYDGPFQRGVFVAVGDVNGDGSADLITGPRRGKSARVRALNLADDATLVDQTLEAPSYRRGTTVASGDVNADGLA
ncbi:MAG TPA: Calx-beta domain-containing protein, partial [Tepidisphaeraceae bacterium]